MTPIQKLQYRRLIKRYTGSTYKYIFVTYTGGVYITIAKPGFCHNEAKWELKSNWLLITNIGKIKNDEVLDSLVEL